ncbi:lasso peptide biosynthesis B2 protein [Lipingzhangella sp. LS1_29]|uniref:Lasso peptide biosynthesis B2 protein n=1 Tax=Lipingzhangella rawalii TaxID=2055835 RepID=A0ABU2H2G6_9ACTN|nr:lasso peptide biosynthesis B2 protein [Lipingzhangella rawalii]MDS1269064.1 lasso peptide biosynthesis B2 protein [Lipingzhangella rawalii]
MTEPDPTGLPTPRIGDWVTAVAGVATALVVLRLLPLHRTLALVRLLRRTSRAPAGRLAALRSAQACRRIARRFPGRTACLDVSLATVVTTALRWRSVSWCIGCRFSPCQSHAWVEVRGVPVAEPVLTTTPFHVTVRV